MLPLQTQSNHTLGSSPHILHVLLICPGEVTTMCVPGVESSVTMILLHCLTEHAGDGDGGSRAGT